MTKNKESCKYCFGPNCWYITTIENQAQHGGLTREGWNNFVSELEEVKKSCRNPEELTKKVNSVTPNLID